MNPRDYRLWARRFDNHRPQQMIAALAFGLASEAGEVLGELEKSTREGNTLDVESMIDEIGDVLWNVARLADELGYTLEYLFERNISKLLKRYEERGIDLKPLHTPTPSFSPPEHHGE